MHIRHNIIEDFGEVIMTAYDRFLSLEKEMQELIPRAEKNKFAAAKLVADPTKTSKTRTRCRPYTR
jgi:RNA polymerase primary sigma factor